MRHPFCWRVVILRREIKTAKRMETSLILTVALAAAIIVIVLALVAVIVFQRWRISDNNAHLKEFIDENLELRRKIRQTGMSVALLCLTATAMAQTPSDVSWRYSDRFPKLPPLRVEFDDALFAHSQPNWLQMPLGSIQKKDTVRIQSIMFRHQEHHSTTQFHFKSRPDYSKMVDNLGGLRDYIVRKRRWDEGRPLQPLAPGMRR